MVNALHITFLVPLLALAVVLNGAHAKDIILTPAGVGGLTKTDEHAKIATDLHNHVDKQSAKSLLKAPADTYQTDARSLRLRDHKKHPFYRTTAGKLLGAWYDQLTLHLNV